MLSGPEIRRQIELGHIVIDPFNPSAVQPNSYDLTLAPTLAVYDEAILDSRRPAQTREFAIPGAGLVLHPGTIYLAATAEWTETRGFVPAINGKSSLGRLGLSVHATAGFGDDGFRGKFTLELSVIKPLRVYAGMRVCQIAYHELTGEPMPYRGRYQDQSRPTPSLLWRDHQTEGDS